MRKYNDLIVKIVIFVIQKKEKMQSINAYKTPV